MTSLRKALLALAASTATLVPSGIALDITINDNYANSGFGGGPLGSASEDNEVEQGALAVQAWDYEAFTLTGSSLGLVAGFDMKSGIDGDYQAPQGDIFIRIGSRVDPFEVGNGSNPVEFDYVIHFPAVPPPLGEPFPNTPYWNAGSDTVQYQVFARNQLAGLLATGDAGIEGANALLPNFLWQATPSAGATPIFSGMADYADDVAAPYAGGATAHDILSGIDLSWLAGSGDAYLFTTMGCGNDMIQGKASVPVPDGGTMLVLLGMALAGFGAHNRTRKG